MYILVVNPYMIGGYSLGGAKRIFRMVQHFARTEKVSIACFQATFHYVPLHTSPFAKANLGTKEGDLPVTEKVARTLVRIPVFPTLKNEQVDRVVDAVRSFFYG